MFGALSYNQEKVDEGHARVLYTNRIIEPTDGNFNIPVCLRSFEPYLDANQNTEKPVLHISLNPSPDDKLSDEQFAEIAQEYMEKLGYGNQPYLIYKHEDIGRHHLHIVSVRVDEEGKKLPDAFEYRRSKDITRELEKKYGLKPAERKEEQPVYQLKKINPYEGDVKRQLSNTLKALLQSYKFQSMGEYRALLSLYHINMEEVKGERRGQQFTGIVYSTINDKGEKVGNPIKSSRIGKVTGNEALLRKMEQSKKSLQSDNQKERAKREISGLMQTSKSKEDFSKELKSKDIDVVFRENESGRIYGVTFIDHQEQVVLNGSRLGKEFSANVFNDYFKGEYLTPENNLHQTHSDDFIPYEKSHQQQNPMESAIENAIGGLFDILPINENTYEENPQFPKQKKKKKRRYGRQF